MAREPVTRETERRYDEPERPAPAGLARPRPPPAGPSWRDQVQGASSLNVLAGIWLIIAPWVLGYTAADPKGTT